MTANAAEDFSSAATDTDGDGFLDSATTAAAAASAEEAGKPVEDLSQRGETATTVANPDGTFTVRDYAAAIRVKDEDGDWADVNYTLEKKPDGTYGPKAAQGDVSIGGGGSGDAASVKFADGTGVALTWPEDLPEPTISKGTATYKISDSADLLVSVTASGLATRIRLNDAPKADDPALTLGLETTNLNIDQPSDDKLEFERTSGKRLGTVSSMAAWDSRRDEFGDPVEVVPVEASLEKADTTGSTVTHDMELNVPDGFLQDADTKYPVMIDPDISAVSLTQDTWVRSGTSTVDTLPYRLLVGRIASHSSDMPAHSYIQWSNTQLAEKNITAATMNLYQYAAGSCSAKSMNIHPLENTWSENTTTWYANKPNGMTDTGTSTSLTEMRGGDGCAANGYVSTSIRDMAQAWADGSTNGGFTNRGVQLNVPSANGTDVSYERRFCSSEPDTTTSSCTTATRTPYLSITYNSYPGTASTPVATVNGSEVTFTSHATDPDGGMVRIQFEISQAGRMLSGGYSELVASGASASRTLPSLDNGSYTVRAWADDGQLASKQATPSIGFAVNSTDADLCHRHQSRALRGLRRHHVFDLHSEQQSGREMPLISRQVTQSVAMVVALGAVAGCGASENRAIPITASSSSVPLTLAVDPPADPPSVTGRGGAKGGTPQVRNPAFGVWFKNRKLTSFGNQTNISWPKQEFAASKRAEFRFHTAKKPDSITISFANRVNSSTGIPDGDVMTLMDCGSLTIGELGQNCSVAVRNDETVVQVSTNALSGPKANFVVVHATWHGQFRKDLGSAPELWAAWLFKVGKQ